MIEGVHVSDDELMMYFAPGRLAFTLRQKVLGKRGFSQSQMLLSKLSYVLRMIGVCLS